MDLKCPSCNLEINRIDEDYINNPIYDEESKRCPFCSATMEVISKPKPVRSIDNENKCLSCPHCKNTIGKEISDSESDMIKQAQSMKRL